MKHKILFLGSSDNPLYQWLKEKKEDVYCTSEKISPTAVIQKQYTFLISYGYRHILRKNILDLFPNTAINLHISFLPYNRGADPNFWSFIENTPKGVTIHYIDEGVDTGDIIIQKKVDFEDIANASLASTYQKLHAEIQQLFIQHWASIKNGQCERRQQQDVGTTHKTKDKIPLSYLLRQKGWDTPVSTLTHFKKAIK